MQVVDVVLVMMDIRFVEIGVIVATKLEEMRQGWEQEQQEFENELLGRSDTHQQRQQPHDFQFYYFNNKYYG